MSETEEPEAPSVTNYTIARKQRQVFVEIYDPSRKRSHTVWADTVKEALWKARASWSPSWAARAWWLLGLTRHGRNERSRRRLLREHEAAS